MNKIPSASDLVTETYYNAKISDIDKSILLFLFIIVYKQSTSRNESKRKMVS